MTEFRRLSFSKNVSAPNELYALLDELGKIDTFETSLILSALKDHDPEVRCYAVRKLGLAGLGRQNIVNGLVDALHDEFTAVRQYASAALGVLEPLPVSAISAIRLAMADEDSAVRDFSAANLKLIERHIASESIAS